MQVDLFTYLIDIILFVRIISRFIKLFGFVIHFFQGWYRNIMSLALKKFLVNVLVLGKNLREYSRTLVTRTLKGNEKWFKLAGNSSYRGKFQWNCDQGKGNLVRVRREFKLSNFQLSRFYSNKFYELSVLVRAVIKFWYSPSPVTSHSLKTCFILSFLLWSPVTSSELSCNNGYRLQPLGWNSHVSN